MTLGCADNNLFSGLADDDSDQAKLEEAIKALDDGDCEKAIDLFAELQADDPERVDRRLNLSAAYLCQAGFNVAKMIEIAAELAGQEITENELFQAIADRAVEIVSPTWPEDTADAIEVLRDPDAQPTGLCPIVPFKSDPDAAFNLSIAELVRATVAIVDFTEYAEGAALSGQVDDDEAEIIGEALLAASDAILCTNDLLGGGILDTAVADLIVQISNDLHNIDGDPNNALTAADVENYLCDQGVSIPGACP
jgi:hypothetical protein